MSWRATRRATWSSWTSCSTVRSWTRSPLGLGAGYAPLRVYNDVDVDLVNLFRCARDRPLALLRELDFLPLHARADFEVVLRFLNHG